MGSLALQELHAWGTGEHVLGVCWVCGPHRGSVFLQGAAGAADGIPQAGAQAKAARHAGKCRGSPAPRSWAACLQCHVSPGSRFQRVSSCRGAVVCSLALGSAVGTRVPSAELIRSSQPQGWTMQPSPPPGAAGQTHGTGGWAALAGCSQAVRQQPCLVPVPRQLIEGCFSSFHCFINLEQCTACKWERAGALRRTERAVLQPSKRSHGRGGRCTAAPGACRSTGALPWVPG